MTRYCNHEVPVCLQLPVFSGGGGGPKTRPDTCNAVLQNIGRGFVCVFLSLFISVFASVFLSGLV